MGNRLVSMAQAAKLFGFSGTAHGVAKKARRRLQAISDNDPAFVMFKPAGSREWHTTIEDLRRSIPELFRNDPECSSDVLDAIDDLGEKVSKLCSRVAKVERVQFVDSLRSS